MKYLLDTCTISHFIKGHPSISQHLKATHPNLLSISTTTVMEIEYGLKLNPARAAEINAVIETLFAHMHILPFETRDAKIAGSLRAELKKAGTPIGPYDLIIASQAVGHGLILVTQNTREFERIPALMLDDWLTLG
jgi:tRNA(fMet)-specific endonuclease VapC